jgi:hypothetical protein
MEIDGIQRDKQRIHCRKIDSIRVDLKASC